MNRVFSVLLGASFLFASGALFAGQTDHDRLVNELMHKSGMVKQVSLIPQQIQAALVQTQQQQGQLTQAQFDELNSLMITTYNSERLLADVTTHVRHNLTSSNIKDVLVWLNSDLGKKITRAEEEASTGEAALKIQEIALSINNQDSKRLALMAKLDDVVRATESSVIMLQGIQIAMTMAMMSGLPEKDQIPLADLSQRVKAGSEQLYNAMRPQVLAAFLYTYRNIADGEVNKYIDFSSTKVANKYHAATMNALSIALSKASEDFGARLR